MSAAATCDLLARDHELIGKALTALERIAVRFTLELPVSAGEPEWVVDFLGRFADSQHRDAEEEVLFPALERAAQGSASELVRRLRSAHEVERTRMRTMCRTLGDLDTPAERAAFCDAARSYVSLTRRHIEEEAELFETARRVLDPAQDAQIADRLARHRGADAAQWARDEARLDDVLAGLGPVSSRTPARPRDAQT
jgi:hemerythrin-like domain-containing protein